MDSERGQPIRTKDVEETGLLSASLECIVSMVVSLLQQRLQNEAFEWILNSWRVGYEMLTTLIWFMLSLCCVS